MAGYPLRARRAVDRSWAWGRVSGAGGDRQTPFLDDADPENREFDTEPTYFELLREIGRKVELRVIVDIIAGASAGGINGTMLARALSQSVESDASERLILEEGLRRLSALDQEIMLLHHWEGLTFESIGVVLQAPRNTILSRYARAIERLRGFLGAPAPADACKQRGASKRQEVRC